MKKILPNKKIIIISVVSLVVVVALVAGVLSRPKTSQKSPQAIEKPQVKVKSQQQISVASELAVDKEGMTKTGKQNVDSRLRGNDNKATRPYLSSALAKQQLKAYHRPNSSQLQTFEGQEMSAENEDDSQMSTEAQQRPYLPPRKFKPLFENKPVQTITPELQRHNENYQILANNQRPPISAEQQEQMKKEMFSRIPERYRKLFDNIDQMKAEQLEKSKQTPSAGFVLTYSEKDKPEQKFKIVRSAVDQQ